MDDTTPKKARKRNGMSRLRKASGATLHAYLMQGVEDPGETVSRNFGPHHPQYVQLAERVAKHDAPIPAAKFAYWRRHIMHMTQAQCAAYLGVGRTSVIAWEGGDRAIPRAAFLALFWSAMTPFFRLAHHRWDGWYIEEASGRLVHAGHPELAFGPGDLAQLHREGLALAAARGEADTLRTELARARAENTTLREAFLAAGVVDELNELRDRMDALFRRINTARVIDLQPQERSA